MTDTELDALEVAGVMMRNLLDVKEEGEYERWWRCYDALREIENLLQGYGRLDLSESLHGVGSSEPLVDRIAAYR
jgi:hypothetical protein